MMYFCIMNVTLEVNFESFRFFCATRYILWAWEKREKEEEVRKVVEKQVGKTEVTESKKGKAEEEGNVIDEGRNERRVERGNHNEPRVERGNVETKVGGKKLANNDNISAAEKKEFERYLQSVCRTGPAGRLRRKLAAIEALRHFGVTDLPAVIDDSDSSTTSGEDCYSGGVTIRGLHRQATMKKWKIKFAALAYYEEMEEIDESSSQLDVIVMNPDSPEGHPHDTARDQSFRRAQTAKNDERYDKNATSPQTVNTYINNFRLTYPPVLIIDEPTGAFDREGLGALASAVKEFTGTMIMVSHNLEFVEGCGCAEKWIMDDGVLEITKSSSLDDYWRPKFPAEFEFPNAGNTNSGDESEDKSEVDFSLLTDKALKKRLRQLEKELKAGKKKVKKMQDAGEKEKKMQDEKVNEEVWALEDEVARINGELGGRGGKE
jgi:hypothetical protein